ncbi:hypothetical protein MSG28_011369 [Choristoneura fumiferana]|uniref:Uncharacterized protein n=1 Tax=Choristoneura fumiferana TaxID=7141 RepID=A0ACC0JN07_CHOFU|nr:hypothetical protein MSG28_011369 [Choristoneura fumiferana]
MYQTVSHVLFDMDGLILNTEELYTIGFENIASRYGKKFTFELKCKIMGQQTREFAKMIIEGLDLPLTVDEFIVESREIFNELFPNCKVLPGVEKLIHHLHNSKIPIGLATSSSKESYELKTQKHQDLFDLFPYRTWGSSDPLCLVFEDSLNGVLAGRAGGYAGGDFPDTRLDRSLAVEAGATLVLSSMEDFRPELFGLPPYLH